MPSAIVLHLSTSSTIPDEYFGRQTQAWFLDLIRRVDAATSEELHRQERFKPYTVSGLLPITIGLNRRDLMSSNHQCLLRITFADDALANFFQTRVLTIMPDTVKLWWIEFKIENIYTKPEQNKLAGSDSYQDLEIKATGQPDSMRTCLHFFSPTKFHSGKTDVPIPQPGSVFNSLCNKWNAYCPSGRQVKNEDWFLFASQHIAVTRQRHIKTHHILYNEGARGGDTGFTGEVEFTLIPKNDYEQFPPEAWQEAGKMMQMFASYAFYTGVGHHTTRGLGQTRLLKNGNDSMQL
jgi:CRISPR-associated endoribonuclease Cas6